MTNIKEDFLDLAHQGGSDGRADLQRPWHIYFKNWFWDPVLQHCHKQIDLYDTHLDVGSGLGKIKERFPDCITQDVAPDLDVNITFPIDHLDEQYDLVTCFDVIEHIKHLTPFIDHLVRLTKRYLIVTTPNYNVSKNTNPYHYQEFTPMQFLSLFSAFEGQLFLFSRRDNDITYHLSLDTFVKHKDPDQAILWERICG